MCFSCLGYDPYWNNDYQKLCEKTKFIYFVVVNIFSGYGDGYEPSNIVPLKVDLDQGRYGIPFCGRENRKFIMRESGVICREPEPLLDDIDLILSVIFTEKIF